MNPILTDVQKLAFEDNQPKFISWIAFTYFNKIHFLWRYWRISQLYTQPDNFVQLVAGRALAYAANKSTLLNLTIRYPVQYLLIATRILECKDQIKAVQEAKKEWLDALFDKNSTTTVEWETNSKTLSPSTLNDLKFKKTRIKERVYNIAITTLRLIKQVFELSMKIMDVIDAFYFSTHSTQEALNESFVNIGKCMNKLVENKKELLDGLNQHRSTIDKLIKVTNAPLTFEGLYSVAESSIGKAEFIDTINKNISKTTKDVAWVVYEVAKESLKRFSLFSGLDCWLPKEYQYNS